jgi:CheY-like chemotaxis protein
MTQGRADDKGLELRLDIDSTLPDVLHGDEIRIKQVIINIMTNAVKYTEEGWIELSVTKKNMSEYLDDDNISLEIKVSDSGMGIREDEMSKLFTEFERLDRQKNKSIEGTGLGLSITSRLVSLMNGKISVHSIYGKGSTFSVSIPQKVVTDVPIGDYKKRFEILSNEKTEKDKETLENMRFPGKKVYVVDDNEMNLEVIASILEMLDIQVDRAGGGQMAIDHLNTNVYDLILTDDMMPEINGTELMQYLHQHEESASHSTPIVVLTANAVAGAREDYIRKGFDDYMTKPLDIDILQKILIKYLK